MTSSNQISQSLYSWGFSKYGQTSIENCQFTDEPNQINIPLIKDIISISCGEFNSGFILKDNKTYMFGLNTFGQLGNDTNKNKSRKISYIPLVLPVKFKKISIGGGHVLGLSLEDEVYSWGLNIFGQLGLGHFDNIGICTLVDKLAFFDNNGEIKEVKKTTYQKILDIKAGAQHSIILLNDGNIYSCGFAKFGALGYYFPETTNNNNKENNNNTSNSPNENNLFTKIEIEKNIYDNEKEKITYLAAGFAHSGCVIDNKNFLLWGKDQGLYFDNIQKYSINDLLNEEKKEKKISDTVEIKKLEIGKNFAVILTNTGHVLTEGENCFGQLGKKEGGGNDKIFFGSVKLPEKIEDISVGYETIYALTAEKKNILAWGSNKFGQIPDLKKNFTYEPTPVMKLNKLSPKFFSCGGYHVLALCNNTNNNKEDQIDEKVRYFKNLPLNKCFNVDEYMKKEIYYDKINENFDKQQNLIDSINEKEKECQKIMKEITKKEKLKKEGKDSKDSSNNTNIAIEKLLDGEISYEELVFPENAVIGSGAFGEVKKAFWRKTLVSVKFLKTSSENKENQIIPFIEEFNLLKQLRHPNILLYIGGNISGPQYFLVTEFCENGNLFELLHGKNAVDLADSDKINLALEIAQGINYLHSFDPPILHRDLKSLNILLDKNYVVKIADFGWARLRNNHMTKLRGTFQWMAPEVISNENYTEKADVYSFGIILWEFWSKDPPYKGIPAKEVGNKIKTEKDYRPKIPKDVPKEISQLIVLCWDFEPSNRPSFIEIINFLNDYLKSIQENN